ncbi:MAG: hypothetical protein N4A49_09535 [Marinifilaceae bacterium]|jgi:tetratricopeptide (TPR) repeat protein|nr:hypothetical protein [Marinifilaceae bacterium]
MTGGEFEKSINIYHKLAKDYPASKGLYLSQIGVGFYFMGDRNKAIEYYILALNNGADTDMIDDNVWEACEEIYEEEKNKAIIEKYLEYFPDGNYKKKAKKIVSK